MDWKKETIPALEEIRRLMGHSGLGRRGIEKKAKLSRGCLEQIFARDLEIELADVLAILDVCQQSPGEFFARTYPDSGRPRRLSWKELPAVSKALAEDDEQVVGLPEHGIGSLEDLRERRTRCERAVSRLETLNDSGVRTPPEAADGDRPLSALDLCHRLIREADDLQHRHPERAVREAERARDLAAGFERDAIGHPEWFALQADAWAVLGSAYRSAGELRQAEGALNVALALLDAQELRDHLDPLAHPRLAQRASYLRCAQERFDEALLLNEEALSAYEILRDLQRLAGALLDRVTIVGWSGRNRAAVLYLAGALELMDPEENPRYHLAAVHNMALALHQIAETREENLEALEWLRLARRNHTRTPEEINLLNLRMIEGSTAVRLGQVAEGIETLWMAHDGFERLGSVHDQAIVLLRLAGVFLAQGHTDKVKRISGQLFPIFRRLEVDRETNAALMLFFKSAQTKTATLDLVEQVTRRMERAFRRPRLLS